MALLVLSSCTEFPLTYADLQGLPDETPYRQQALSDGWISTDRAQLILERRDRSVIEQRILLTNRTAMKGENLILLRAETAPNALETRFQPELLLADTGGVPAPFGRFESLSFTVTEDALGVINWTSWTNYAGLTCVLAFRRLDMTQRTLVPGARVMDIMLRDCIHGEAATALAPIGADSISFGARPGKPGSSPQMLSPLAAPLP